MGEAGSTWRRHRKVRTREKRGSEAKSVQHIRYSHASAAGILRRSLRPLVLIKYSTLHVAQLAPWLVKYLVYMVQGPSMFPTTVYRKKGRLKRGPHWLRISYHG